ncbi:hypothetical protein B0H11DRAFT_2232677 [Mycena galericulata]|nr:hypothetical protein B0H11DRAFT_2232677 [Mycena galericulata]
MLSLLALNALLIILLAMTNWELWRQKMAPWGLQLGVDAKGKERFTQSAQLVQPHLNQMMPNEHADWASPTRQAAALEYQMAQPRESHILKDKITETTRFLTPFISLDSDEDQGMPDNDADHVGKSQIT